MAKPRAYSERFIQTSAQDTWVYYYCPLDRRLVVRHVAITVSGVAGDFAQVEINGTNVVMFVPPAQVRQQFYEVRFTLYWGQRVGFYGHGTQTTGVIDGFSFEDLQGPGELYTPNEAGQPPAAPVLGVDIPLEV